MKESALVLYDAISEINPAWIEEAGKSSAFFKRKRRIGKVLFRAGAIAAASVVLLIVVGFYQPVLAEKIPFLGRVVELLRNLGAPAESVARFGAVEDYLLPTGMEDADFRVDETYYDGSVFAATVELKIPDAGFDAIQPEYALSVSGESEKSLLLNGVGLRLTRQAEDTFIGTLSAFLPDLGEARTVTVELSVTRLHTVDGARELFLPSDHQTCSLTVEKQNLAKKYPVDQEFANGEVSIYSLITTPAITYLDAEIANGYYVQMLDQDGEPLGYVKIGTGNEAEVQAKYRTALEKQTTAVVLEVFSRADRNTPIGSVTVPVEGGYANGALQAQWQENAIQQRETEMPSQDSISFGGIGGKISPLGETVNAAIGGAMTVCYSNLRVFESPARAGLSEEEIYRSESGLDMFGGQEAKFVLLDLQIENHGVEGMYGGLYSDEIDEYDNNDGTASVFWIYDFTKRQQIREDRDRTFAETNGFSELVYFSEGQKALGSYYHFVMNLNDIRNFTVGFYVSSELLEAENVAIGSSTGNYRAAGNTGHDKGSSWSLLS